MTLRAPSLVGAAEAWTRKDLEYTGGKGTANETHVLYGSLSGVYLFAQ